MSDRIDLLGAARNLLSLLWGVLGYVLRYPLAVRPAEDRARRPAGSSGQGD